METTVTASTHLWLLLLPPLLCLHVRPTLTSDARAPVKGDTLRPYTQGHGPAHSHRHVRSCQLVVYGNTTHETWPSSNLSSPSFASSSAFVTDVPGTSRFAYGRFTVVDDPLRTLSVLEPVGPGGCWLNQKSSVVETAKDAECVFAQNAGFFEPDTGKCLGNIVSDGKMVLDSGGVQNAQFGIRKDGTLVFGYLSHSDIRNSFNPFVQLVSGVIWLLRNGEIYINQSLEAECDATQTTGQLQTFVDVVSARTAVGHDAEGRVVLLHIEGQTGVRGMNLWEVAEFLKKNGVVNAINLDGGGSSTFVAEGFMASYPSDHCTSDNRWRCDREVSTILCVHRRRCNSPDCSGHGRCVDGQCVCAPGWTGIACHALLCQPPACGAHGLCGADGCVCDAGWRGTNCSQECLPGFYGYGCNQTCDCLAGSSCDPVRGLCTCPAGYHGDRCQHVCPLGFFGPSCAHTCDCDHACPCDPLTGNCNATLLPPETYSTLHIAGQCLDSGLWSRTQLINTYRKHDYLSELTWLILTTALASLLLLSLVFNVVQAQGSTPFSSRRLSFSYLPLSSTNGQTPLLHPEE